ncbi:O-antigen ligase family protein [Gimesia aquarii]|uniref:O-Antigen ligase n=1 Tax=Gimesia aquarii TaxID=2527964 RepID=A0A517WWV7_9PLAN|nr:O-antigen ligase family protein [Gimesia aquarii]QDU09751.1 O-Antigen ligase [Gimesia aquarii]
MHIFEGNLRQSGPQYLMNLNRSRFKEQAYQTGILLSIATGFAIPVSTSLTSILSFGVLVCWVISGQYLVSFEILKKYRVSTASAVFFSFLMVGLFYTPESFSIAARNLFKYRQFILIPVYLSFFLDPQTRHRGIQMFELAMIMTLLGSIYYTFSPLNGLDDPFGDRSIFKNRITQNILMSFLVYLAAWKFLEKPRQCWPYAILVLVATFNIIAMVPGRSGYLALAILICVLMYQKMGLKGLIPAAVCVGGVGLLAYSQSELFQGRINQAISEISEYRVSKTHHRGVNLRMEFYENSLHLAKSNPLFGSGIGSFNLKYHQMMQEKGQISTANPHNEYIMLLVQNGVIGVSLFLTFFWICWRATRSMIGLDRAFGQAVIAVYFVGCLVNSLMLDTTEGILFGYLIGITFAGGISSEEERNSVLPESSTETVEQAIVRNAA